MEATKSTDLTSMAMCAAGLRYGHWDLELAVQAGRLLALCSYILAVVTCGWIASRGHAFSNLRFAQGKVLRIALIRALHNEILNLNFAHNISSVHVSSSSVYHTAVIIATPLSIIKSALW